MKNTEAVKAGQAGAAGLGTIEVSVHDAKSGTPVTHGAILLYPWAGAVECNDNNLDQWDRDTRSSLLPLIRFTDAIGHAVFADLSPASYIVVYDNVIPALSKACPAHAYARCAKVHAGCSEMVCFRLAINARVDLIFQTVDCQPSKCLSAEVGQSAIATVVFDGDANPNVQVIAQAPWEAVGANPMAFGSTIDEPGLQLFQAQMLFGRRLTAGASAGVTVAAAAAAADDSGAGTGAAMNVGASFKARMRPPLPISGNVNVSMTRTETEPTPDLRLWASIRASTDALSFDNYMRFMDQLFCSHDLSGALASNAASTAFDNVLNKRFLPFTDTDAYRVMKAATEAFVIVNCGVFTDDGAIEGDLADYLNRRDLPLPGPTPYLESVDNGFGGTIKMLPYLAIIRRKLPDVPFNRAGFSGTDHGQGLNVDLCDGFVQKKLSNPCLLELIWSYWHEEGMQVQTMNTITRRFQNVRGPGQLGQPDPLANLEMNPLRPLNNLIWGYIQDEQHRLSVARRNYEYDHHYGLRLDGRAVQNFRPADTRSKFIEGFHHLLRLCTVFYRQDDDTTVKADAFGVLNALKELHLTISQGAHSQFGDLPPTARIEMLMQQWLLARPEFRDFLPTRVMVAYPEPWMDRVDAMKTLQGWTDTSVMHFHNLAVFGEQIVLAIRYGAWSVVVEPTQAFNFARFWRPQVQGYIHAYRAATGVDLSIDAGNPVAEATLPSVLLRQRLAQQARSA
jgi:hypothetical protein